MNDEPPRSRIYLASPPLREAAGFAPMLEEALAGAGAACLLLDLESAAPGDAKKIARELTPLAQKRDAAVLLRDPSLVAKVAADGAHLSAAAGGFEEALDAALAALQPGRIVGLGGVDSRHLAMLAGERGVDYVMFGDPRPNEANLSFEAVRDLVAWWAEIFTTPCVAFAAEPEQAGALLRAGADFVAFSSAIWSDPRGVGEVLRAALADFPGEAVDR